MCAHMGSDRIRNEDIQGQVGVAAIEDQISKNWLRWFGNIKRNLQTLQLENAIMRQAWRKRGENDPERLGNRH